MQDDPNQTQQLLMAAQERLQASEAELRIAEALFQSLQAVMVTNGRGIIQRVNEAFLQLTGYEREEILGRTPKLLRSGHHDEPFYAAMREEIARSGQWQGEIWDRHKSGAVFPKWLTIRAVGDGQGAVTHFVATYMDIRERKQAEDRIRQLSFYDALTQLANRSLMLEMLGRAMAAGAHSGRQGAVLLIDLDRFKLINDSLGHTQGDLLLQQAGQRLRQCVGEGGTVARIGGDEFAIVLPDLCASRESAACQAEQAAEQVMRALGEAYRLGDGEYRGTASVGVALFSGSEASGEEVLKQAELAMYKAKSDGRNGLRFFEAALEEAAHRRLFLEREMDRALAARQFLLHYQPQVEGGVAYGAEALVRWRHPERGLISPAEFIPLAEETGQIVALGGWVLDCACDQLAAWAAHPVTAGLELSVNISASQFLQEDFVDRVAQALERSGITPAKLKLELTESLMAGNADGVIKKMHALKDRGVRLSLDDFGTGYSSLSYLRRMPFDQLKIDQSFVREVLTDANAAAIARSIAALAHSLGLAVVAEGVETAEQRDFLNDIGCTKYQGYFYSRPLPLAEFERYLHAAAQ
ncbi:MAG: EAL domain-containing protein [Zoogloeaceae bacterium]|nr:EAL domain-containing protein [Zoogloeaceae bacterium]